MQNDLKFGYSVGSVLSVRYCTISHIKSTTDCRVQARIQEVRFEGHPVLARGPRSGSAR